MMFSRQTLFVGDAGSLTVRRTMAGVYETPPIGRWRVAHVRPENHVPGMNYEAPIRGIESYINGALPDDPNSKPSNSFLFGHSRI